MENKKKKFSDIVLGQIAEVQLIGFEHVNPDLQSKFKVISSYFEKQVELKQLHPIASYFVDLKNKSILDKHVRDAMLYDVLSYLVSCIECSINEDKIECMQYLKAAQRLLLEAKNYKE